MRAIFFEEEAALRAATRLVADGFEAMVTRERFQGEDDDEDHPWAVLSDAPAFLMDLIVEQYDGWLDEESASPPAEPLELPDAPRRVKGHFTDGNA